MADFFDNIDLNGTIKSYEYTRRAIRGMHMTFNEKDFDEMDSEHIVKYLAKTMEAVSFGNFLKRYVYMSAKMSKPFNEVELSEYIYTIRACFEEYNAPYSFTGSSRKPKKTVEAWLTQDSVKRNVVFLLGFGLGMSADDVEYFLLMALQESGYDYTDPREVIFRFCFANKLRYAKAEELIAYYEEVEPSGLPTDRIEELLADLPYNKYFDLSKEGDVKKYLACLKNTSFAGNNNNYAWRMFDRLLLDTKECIAALDNEDEDRKKDYLPEDISDGEVERNIYSGVPLNKAGNLLKTKLSLITPYISNKRLNRQKIARLSKREETVTRFDLITLKFYITAQKTLDWDPSERCTSFVKEMNEILEACAMGPLYPVHPYEAVILLCLNTIDPVNAFSRMWELSYNQENDTSDKA